MHDSKQTLVRYIAIITDILTMFAVYLVANYIKFGNFRTGLNNPQDYYLGVFTTSLIFYIIVYFFIPSRESIIYRNWIQEVFDVVKMEIYIIALTVGYYTDKLVLFTSSDGYIFWRKYSMCYYNKTDFETIHFEIVSSFGI